MCERGFRKYRIREFQLQPVPYHHHKNCKKPQSVELAGIFEFEIIFFQNSGINLLTTLALFVQIKIHILMK